MPYVRIAHEEIAIHGKLDIVRNSKASNIGDVVKMVHARLIKNIREAILVICLLTFTGQNILALWENKLIVIMLIQSHIIYEALMNKIFQTSFVHGHRPQWP